MKTTYRIRDWDEHFENSESRKLKTARFVLVPVKHDGKGYRRVAAHERSAELFGAWMVIIQVAAKMPVRGTLADEDGPLTAEDLHFITGLPEELFELAFSIFQSPGILWMESETSGENTGISRNLPESPGTSGSAGKNPPRREGKGIEGNGTEEWAENPPATEPDEKKPEPKFRAENVDIPETLDVPTFREKWHEYLKHRRSRKLPCSEDWVLKNLDNFSRHGPEVSVRAMDDSMLQHWKGVFPDKPKYRNGLTGASGQSDDDLAQWLSEKESEGVQ